MTPKSALCTLAAAGALAALVAFPPPIQGQAAPEGEALINQLLVEATAQQSVIAENQVKIDAQIAAITEEVRVARLFAARTGGKVK